MSATITTVRDTTKKNGKGLDREKTLVFIESNPNPYRTSEGFFQQFNCGAMKTKCKNLSKIQSAECAEIADEIELCLAGHGASVESVKFDRYAGCSCPCSPGYVVKLKGNAGDPARGKTFWMNVTLEPLSMHRICKVAGKAIEDETKNPTP